jgi:hypothetical protein
MSQATTPNSVIVHNWAFASTLFRESMQQEERIKVALAEAASQPLLTDAIARAQAMRSAAKGDERIGPNEIRSENRDTFYSALGMRLTVLQKLPDARGRQICHAILDQCFRHGPRGLDAAVFCPPFASICMTLSTTNHISTTLSAWKGIAVLTPLLEMLKSTS